MPALAYLAELLVRAAQTVRARAVLAELHDLELTESERTALSDELSATAQLEDRLKSPWGPAMATLAATLVPRLVSKKSLP